MKKLLLFLTIICFSNVCVQAATDNVLQSIQIDSYKDTYNIILKADNKPESKRNIVDENRMTISLKGVRASEELNTVYNATSIDSVTVEPTGSNSVDVIIQAKNASRANLIFDTLDTPLGVLRTQKEAASNSETLTKKTKKAKNKIFLSHPMKDYRSVYGEDSDDETALSSFIPTEASSFISMFKNEGFTNALSVLLIGLIIFCVVKLFKKNNKENDNMQIGLSQSLKNREMDIMQDMMQTQSYMQNQGYMQNIPSLRPEMNYGIRSYQNTVKAPYQQHGMRSPYVTSDINIGRQPVQNIQPIKQKFEQPVSAPVQSTINLTKKPISSSKMTTPQSGKVASVDSMKFLDSIAKIYEKNGNADLAQGLKVNMTKAKSRV